MKPDPGLVAAGNEGQPCAATDISARAKAAFQSGQYKEAAQLYQTAFAKAQADSTLASNFSAAFLAHAKQLPDTAHKTEQLGRALEAAETCVKLKPDWYKAHFRQAQVLEELGRCA